MNTNYIYSLIPLVNQHDHVMVGGKKTKKKKIKGSGLIKYKNLLTNEELFEEVFGKNKEKL